MSAAQMNLALNQGVSLDDGLVKLEKLEDEGGEGFNHWYRVMLKEGRNRVVRRLFDALGLPVSRLMRIRFGIINLPPRLKRGMTAELGEHEVAQVLNWVGMTSGPPRDSRQSDLGGSGMERHRAPAPIRAAGRAGSTPGNKRKSGVKR